MNNTHITKKKGFTKISQFVDVKWANVTSVFALILIFAKSVLTLKNFLGAFFLVIIIIIGSLPIVPYYFSYGGTINLSLFFVSSFIYGSIFYAFRKSTLFDNIKETNLSKMDIYFSIFVVMFVFTAIVYLFIISIFLIGLATESKLFMNDWFFSSTKSGGYSIKELNVQLMVWWYLAFILLNFSLFYLFQNIVNNQKTFYLFILLYFVLLMIFGSSLKAPYISHIYLFLNLHPEFDSISHNLSNFIEGLKFDPIFSYLNKVSSFDFSYFLYTPHLVKTKIENQQYFSVIMILLTPHYWINIYSSNMMKATSLSIYNFNPQTTDNEFWARNGYTEAFSDAFNAFFIKDRTYIYSEYSFKNAEIWSFSNSIGWILAMYLWIIYFIFFYFLGKCFSKLTNYN